MLAYLDSVTGPMDEKPQLTPQEEEKSVAAMFLDGALGLMKGPAQLWANTKDAVRDMTDPDAKASERPYVKIGSNPAQQNASQVGSLFTAMGTGAMIGSTVGPVGAAIGGTVGAFYGAFVANPTDGNIVDTAKAFGIPVFDAMNKYSHSPTDTAMQARLKNLAADGWFESLTLGSSTAGAKILQSRRVVESGRKAIKFLREEYETAKASFTKGTTLGEVSEAEGQAALKANAPATKKAQPAAPAAKPASTQPSAMDNKVQEAAVNPEAPAPATVTAQQDAATFEQFAQDKMAERRSDLQKITGREVTDDEVLESFEAQYSTKKEQDIVDIKLPKHLAGAKPRYAFGSKQVELSFDADLDRAAYIIAQEKKSARDQEYLQFFMDNTGLSRDEAVAYGKLLRQQIKDRVRTTDASVIQIQAAPPKKAAPTPAPTPVAPAKYAEDVVEAAPEPVLKQVDQHIDEVLPTAESPKYNSNAKEDTRAAIEESSWNVYTATRQAFSPGSVEFAPIYNAGKAIAGDKDKLAAVIKKTTAGEALTIEESAAVLIHSYDNTVAPENAELLAKVMSGAATDAEVAAFQEGMNDIISAYVAPIMLDAVEANTNSLKLGIRRYIKDYHAAGAGEAAEKAASPVPTMRAKMAAINTYIEARGGSAVAAEDAGEFIRWISEAAITGKVPENIPAGVKTVLPRNMPELVAHSKAALAATSQELLAEALPKAAARSWGGKLADGIVSYRVKNMLNHWATPLMSMVGGVGDIGMRTAVNYIKLPYVGSVDLFNKIMRRDTPDLFVSNLARANTYAASLFRNLEAANKLAYESWKVYDPTMTAKSYATDPLERLTAKGIAADEAVEDVATSGGAFGFIKNGFWNVISLGERALFAGDRAIGMLVKEARFASEAAFEGTERGLRGADLEKYINDPPAEIIAKYKAEALEDANRFTYRGTPDIPLFASLVDGHTNGDFLSGAVRFMNPFLRPALISMELVAEHLPGTNLLLPKVRKALASGDPNQISEVMARATAGALPVMGSMMAARAGYVTGPSSDFSTFDEAGKRVPPFSVKVGGKWVPVDKIFGQGMVSSFIKLGATLDAMFDYAEEGQYNAAMSLALFGTSESLDFSRFSVLGDLNQDLALAAKGRMSVSQLADKYALRNIPKSFLPGQRMATDLLASDVERQRVVTGEGIDFVTNALVQTYRETYTPDKLATRPNYFGEPAARRSTFFYTYDTYTSGKENGVSAVPLKVIRDLDSYAKLFTHLGVEQVSVPVWPKVITDPTTGIDVTLTPSLVNEYQQLVMGYQTIGGEVVKMGNQRQAVGAQQDYREATEELFVKYSDVIARFYNNEELTSAEINPLIQELNAQKEFQHSRAKAMITADPRFKAIVSEALAGQAQLGIINYGGSQ